MPKATATTDTPDTAEQASPTFQQDQEAGVFVLPSLAEQSAEKQATATTPDPSTPSGQTPPYAGPPAKGARPGPPGGRRPTPPRIDARLDHAFGARPRSHGPLKLIGRALPDKYPKKR